MDQKTLSQYRNPDFDIEPLFAQRWSPRAMSGEALAQDELMSLFEAARWAPSSFNGQPWRFLYATRDSAHWDRFFGLLAEPNQQWCHRAAALIVVVSRTTYERNGKPAGTHTYDSGAAWQNLALQGSLKGLVVHGMQGFDYKRAARELNVPEDHQVEAMAAVGRPGSKTDLPEGFQDKEQPSPRKPVKEIAFEGAFPE